jgi:hypothetical protein
LNKVTSGSIVKTGNILAEIIPLDTPRRVEIVISNRVSEQISGGQVVTFKIPTNSASFDIVTGIVESISYAIFKDKLGEDPYHKGIVRLDKSFVGNDPTVNQILPGVMVQADVHTKTITQMEYLLKPIYNSVKIKIVKYIDDLVVFGKIKLEYFNEYIDFLGNRNTDLNTDEINILDLLSSTDDKTSLDESDPIQDIEESIKGLLNVMDAQQHLETEFETELNYISIN